MRNNAHSTQLHKPAKGLGRVFPGATGWIPLSLKSRLWNGPPTALLCTALKGGKQRGRSEYLFTASLSTSFAKYTVCEMVIPLTHKGVISWNNFLCIMIWIDGIWTSGERSANLQRNLELCGGAKKMRGNSGALGWDAHDWEYHLCFCLGPNPWWLGGKKKKKIHLQCGRWRFHPWAGKMPWKRVWQPTPVSLPGKFHGQRSLAGYSPWAARVGRDLATKPPPLTSLCTWSWDLGKLKKKLFLPFRIF